MMTPGCAPTPDNQRRSAKNGGRIRLDGPLIDEFRETAYRQLASLKKFSEYDHDVKAMEEAWATPDLSDEQRMQLAFGLGKSFDDLRRYEKAFRFFSAGNDIKRGTYNFSVEHAENNFGMIKKLFTIDMFADHRLAGASDETPIFILGMPRSGTSLVEQILASHPKVHGGGELDYLKNVVFHLNKSYKGIFTDVINQARINQFSNAGTKYIKMIRAHSNFARFITDKMPENFRFIGIIKLMLPNAKIIHCRRNPMDTCLSIFKNLFTGDGLLYTNNLRELGQYYKLYGDLMSYWHSVLPGFIYDIQYEDVVANQEKQSRALLEHCGLEWDDACVEFHKTNQPVQTLSSAQVRRPIYNDSVQAWKRYEKWLTPLLDIIR